MAIFPPNTDPIFAALFALATSATIDGNPAFAFTRRGMMPPEKIPSLPALLMEQLPDDYEAGLNRPPILHLEAHLWIFARVPAVTATSTPPGTILNPLKDAVIAALANFGPNYPNQTLGNLVSNIWINGKIDLDEGLADQRGIVRIPVRILAMDPYA
jgi:hypothetical protein